MVCQTGISLPKPRHIPELFLAIDTISSNLADILSPTLGFCVLGIITISISIASQSVIPSLIGGLTLSWHYHLSYLSAVVRRCFFKPLQLDYCHSFLYGNDTPLIKPPFLYRYGYKPTFGRDTANMVFIAIILLLNIKRQFGYIRYKPTRLNLSVVFCLISVSLLLGCTVPGLNLKTETIKWPIIRTLFSLLLLIIMTLL